MADYWWDQRYQDMYYALHGEFPPEDPKGDPDA